jgi:hypothetical protein
MAKDKKITPSPKKPAPKKRVFKARSTPIKKLISNARVKRANDKTVAAKKAHTAAKQAELKALHSAGTRNVKRVGGKLVRVKGSTHKIVFDKKKNKYSLVNKLSGKKTYATQKGSSST